MAAQPEGITKDQSKQWQKVAALPVAEIKKYIADCD